MLSSSKYLQIYSGTTDIKEFIQHFKIQARYQSWDEKEHVESLPLFLSQKALRVYNAIADKSSTEKIFKEMVTKLAKPADFKLYEFYTRKLAPGETISQYASALQALLEDAIPELPIGQQLTFIRAQLALAVPEHMRALLQFGSSLG
jgi:hypothetical protein